MADPARYMGMKRQGEGEQIAYDFSTTPDGGTPTGVSYTVLRDDGKGTYTDVTSTCMSGGATVTGDVIQLPLLKSLVRGFTYRVNVTFTSGGNILVPWFEVKADR